MMKLIIRITLLVSGLLFLLQTSAYTQVRAITEAGDTIYVYNDGTWSFTLENKEGDLDAQLEYLSMELDIDTLDQIFEADKTLTKEVASKFGFFKIKYDDKYWKRIPPGELNAVAELAFKAQERDIFCMVISEEIGVGAIPALKTAVNSLREKLNGEVKILKVEDRTVNGVKVVRGVFELKLSGITMIFDTYYYSSDKGTVQFTIWTAANLWEKYEADIDRFHNGFIIIDAEKN